MTPKEADEFSRGYAQGLEEGRSTTALDEMLGAARKDQADTDELAFLEWISGTDSDDLPVEPKTERALAERDARVAQEAREAALEEVYAIVDYGEGGREQVLADIRALAKTPAQPRVPLADVLTIVREQPFYPDTNVGKRQQWVKDQIAEKVAALAKKGERK